MAIDVQKIIDTSEYQRVFPETKIWPAGTRYTDGTRNSSEHHIIGRKGKYRGQGVGGSFTGKGANFIIIDDPIKGREIADSEAFRERLWNFYNNDLFSRLETSLIDGRRGQVLITLTRWHEDDLAGRLLELMRKDTNAVQWEIINLPAIKTDNDSLYDPRQLGESLWPEKHSLEQLDQIKASIGPRAWSSLYQQQPVPAGGAMFSDSMFSFADIPLEFDWSFITADTAYTEKQESDFTVFAAWGLIGDQLYLRDVWRYQIKASDIEAQVEPFLRRFESYGFRGIYIEPKGHGIYLNQKLAQKGFMIPSESTIAEFFKDRRFSKTERANNVLPYLANRKVIFNNAMANKEELLNEVLGFPRMKHDDVCDVLIDSLKLVYASNVSILDVL
jgi:predicted phage terminase large subunit-like protein